MRSVWERRAQRKRYVRGKPVILRGAKATFFFNGIEIGDALQVHDEIIPYKPYVKARGRTTLTLKRLK